jgi:outer membrane receptor protein involved in Fe transport
MTMRICNGLLAVAALWLGFVSLALVWGEATTSTSNPSLPLPPPPPMLAPMPALTPMTQSVEPQRISTQPSSADTGTTHPAAASVAPSVTTQQTQQNTASASGEPGKIVVTSDLDAQQETTPASIGANEYTQGAAQIAAIPGGENASFQTVLLRDPGVVADSFGQEHVRGEHANLTYRVNGVILPEPLNGFGQEVDTRLVDSVSLIDGALPSEFGFHTAGIVDVTTKSGETLNHNEVSIYGGSYDTIQPSIQIGGTSGKFDYFVVVSSNHNDIGIENPVGTHRPIHDYTDQEKLFTYLAYRPDDTSRISFFADASYADFQIPNSSGLSPSFTLNGISGFHYDDSSKINENQNEQEYYTVLAYQKTAGNLSFQVSAFSRYGQIAFNPDIDRDLLFQGVSGAIYNNFITEGVQLDSSYILNDQHTIRSGALTNITFENLDTNTNVFATNASGAQASDVPFDIVDNHANQGQESGVYVQDEWHFAPAFTLNYGFRYDRFDSNFDSEDQVSPRANLVWKIDQATTAHVGYARYFVPPPVQNTIVGTVEKFAGTTNAPTNFLADPPKAERSHYFDVGISHQITKPWEVGVDGFYKMSQNLLDLGQFGDALILSPFNYKSGKVYGAEVSTNYKQGGFSLYFNSAWVETAAHDIDSQQFQIDSAELDYIADHNIHLDHEAEFSGSAGASYQWRNDMVYIDFLAATGLRDGFANSGQVQPHYPVNIGYEHIFRPSGIDGHTIKFRADVINLFDEKYVIRDGTGIGVGAPQYGQRLGFFTGLTYEF